MKAIAYFFFYAYIGVVILAGFWGAFINPAFDYKLLFHMDVHSLPAYQRINMISQYRFVRALELGFGVFAILFTENIFTEKKFNELFLFIMASGITARIVSIFCDGSPSGLMYSFLAFELAGWIMIFSYSLKNIYRSGTN